MDPNREDDAVVAYLRANAPGLPAVRFDGRAVTAHARTVVRRQQRRRFRNSAFALAGVATTYLALALAGPLPVPGIGPVSVPGSDTLRAVVGSVLPDRVPGPDQWPEDVDRLEADVLPVVQRLHVRYYLLDGPCRILEYPRGNFRDGEPDCRDLVPFDDRARADFDEITRAVQRSGVAVERIRGDGNAVYIPLRDDSWQYNWEYVYLPAGETRAETSHQEVEEWTHIRGDWWFWRLFDD